jgi:hypothetical protein
MSDNLIAESIKKIGTKDELSSIIISAASTQIKDLQDSSIKRQHTTLSLFALILKIIDES